MSLNNKIALVDLAEYAGGTVDGDGSVIINGIAPIEKAASGQISFIANDRYKKFIETTKASALVLAPHIDSKGIPCIRIKNPYLAFAKLIDLFYPDERIVDDGIDTSSVIHKSAQIDPSAGIGPFCHVSKGAQIGKETQLISSVFIGRDAVIGGNCIFYPGVKILDGTKIGNNVIIHSSTVIGSDGFGYAKSETGLKKIKVCIGYKLGGNKIPYSSCGYVELAKVEPVYRTFNGWGEDIRIITKFDKLPKNCQVYLRFISSFLKVPVKIVSTGPERERNIIL